MSRPEEPGKVTFHTQAEEEGEFGDVELASNVKQQPSPIHAPKPLLLVKVASVNGSKAEYTGVSIEQPPHSEGRLPPVQVTYSDIKFTVPVTVNGKVEARPILKGCNGAFNPGKLTAVMGASGAGKTSLLNIVSGNPTGPDYTGTISLNGIDVSTKLDRIRELSAYIQQDDILMGTQTVREAVTLSARLRLPKSMPDAEKLARVDQTIEMLGLTKCVDTIIGDAFNKGVSGGEKRRVSMALELIKSPAVLFLDEPTSGLDTYTAHSIVALLRDIAHTQGKTIICTIHQPSSDIFHMFDDLLLMADGQVMYHGNAEHVVEYFGQRNLVCPTNFNPADYLFMKVLYNMDEQLKMITTDMSQNAANARAVKKGEADMNTHEKEAANKAQYDEIQETEKLRIAHLLTEWTSSSENAEIQHHIANPLTSSLPDPSQMRAERPGGFYAFQLLSQRRWYDLLRDVMKVRMQFSQYLFFSIILGLIFLQMGKGQGTIYDRQGSLFFVCVQGLFMSFMSNLNTFGPERLVMTREMESGMYTLPSYFFSRWIVELPFRIIFPFVYSTILYWMIGFQATGEHFLYFYLSLMLIDNCGTNMAVMICSVFPDVQQAMQAGPAFILPLMVFSGFYVNISSLGWWFRWISYISPVRYGYCAVIKNELIGLEFECNPSISQCIRTGEEAIELLGIHNDPDVPLNLFILLIILGGFLMGAFFFMWRTTKKR